MKRLMAVLLAVASVSGATEVFAQDAAPGPGAVVVTVIPGGAAFFTEAEDNTQGPSFGNYDVGGAVAVNLNRYLAVEGEVSGALGISQSMQLGTVAFDGRSPHILNYSGNLVGLRGDYRFVAVQSKDEAPAFFGQETRYGHRVYGGVLLNVGR
jgi:hypothetical protein